MSFSDDHVCCPHCKQRVSVERLVTLNPPLDRWTRRDRYSSDDDICYYTVRCIFCDTMLTLHCDRRVMIKLKEQL